MNIAIFKPYSIQNNNAFATGQHNIFKKLNENEEINVTYLIANNNIYFDDINIVYLQVNYLFTIILKIIKKITRKKYNKIPYYSNINLNNYDVVITEGIHYGLLGYLKGFKGTVILNDSITRDYFLPQKQISYLNKFFIDSVAVIVNSKIEDLYHKNKLDLKTQVIGHSIDINTINFKLRRTFDGNIISVGRLVEEKGYKYIIKSISRLVKRYPFLKLDIYGEGPLLDELLNLIKTLKLEKEVRILNFIDHSELLSLLENYSLFVSHPLEMSYIAEAFHMGNMEAMANGIPVITTDCGGVPFVVQDKAIIIEQKSITSLENEIDFLLKNPNMVKKLSVNGREFVEKHYSIDKIVKLYSNILKNL